MSSMSTRCKEGLWSARGKGACENLSEMHVETRHSLCRLAELLDSLLMHDTNEFGIMLIVTWLGVTQCTCAYVHHTVHILQAPH